MHRPATPCIHLQLWESCIFTIIRTLIQRSGRVQLTPGTLTETAQRELRRSSTTKDSKSFILIFSSSRSLSLHKNGDTKKVFLDPFPALLQAHSVRLVHRNHAYCTNLIST